MSDVKLIRRVLWWMLGPLFQLADWFETWYLPNIAPLSLIILLFRFPSASLVKEGQWVWQKKKRTNTGKEICNGRVSISSSPLK